MKFDFNRFVNLGRLFIAQHWKIISIYWISVISITSLIYLFFFKIAEMMWQENNQPAYEIFSQISDFVVIMASMAILYFVIQYILKRRYHNTNTTIGYFQLPASTLEKWLFDFIIVGVGVASLNLLAIRTIRSIFAYITQLINPEAVTTYHGIDFTSSIGILIFFAILSSIWLWFIDLMKNDSKNWRWHSLGLKCLVAFVISSWALDLAFFGLPSFRTGATPTRIPFQTINLPNEAAWHQPYSIASTFTLDQINWYFALPLCLLLGVIYYMKTKEYEV